VIARHLIAASAFTMLAQTSSPSTFTDTGGGALLISHTSETTPPLAYDRAALFLLRGLPERDVADLADALDSYVESMIAREIPLFSLEDDDTEPTLAVDAWMKSHLRETTSAIALAANQWQADDGFHVSLVDHCPVRGECISLKGHDDTRDARRARFLAWVVSKSRVVPASNVSMGKHVALVLSRAALAREPSASELRVREQCARLVRLGATNPWIDALAKSPNAVSLPRVAQGDDVLLVPDIAAIADN
jgi:hypothetical protein